MAMSQGQLNLYWRPEYLKELLYMTVFELANHDFFS